MPMRARDVVALALSALGRHKVRTSLTVLGVAIGTFALVESLAIGLGVDRAIISLFRGTDALRQIMVYINYGTVAEGVPEEDRRVEGEMSEAKRERIRRALVRLWGRRNVSKPKIQLDSAGMAALKRLPHVERVLPYVAMSGRVSRADDQADESEPVDIGSITPGDDHAERIVAGRDFSPGDSRAALIHELVLYRWGLTSEADVERLIGQTIRVEVPFESNARLTLDRLLTFGPSGFSAGEAKALVRALRWLAPLVRLAPLPAAERAAFAKLLERTGAPDEPEEGEPGRYGEEFVVVGVVRDPGPDDPQPMSPAGHWYREAGVILTPAAAEAFYLRDPAHVENGFSQAIAMAERQEDVADLVQAVERLGFGQYSLVQMIATIRMNVTMITFAVVFVAVVALTVAALGITNTMIMSVLERTHEIGIMKALGARDGQVRGIFLVEGASIGVLGGLLGLLAAWAASYPGDAVARSIMEAQTPRPIAESLFAFPMWLTLGAPALAAVVTTLAAVYPAHRAARVDPVTSLRHE